MPKTQEEINAAIDALVNQVVAEPTAEVVTKSESTPEVVAPAAEVAPAADLSKAAPAEAKADDKEADKSDKDGKDSKDPKKKKDEKDKPAFMKKSVEELAEHLSDDELELIKAWREETEEDSEDEVEASAPAIDMEEIVKSIKASVSSDFEVLRKAMSDKDDLIKSLTEKVETISKQPAHAKRSLETLEVIEKGGEEPTISKAQVLKTMLDMQMKGEGINSKHVAEFESTSNLSDPMIKSLVFSKFKS